MSTYWKTHYITDVDPDEVQRALTLLDFRSGGECHQLVCFVRGRSGPNILVSQGSGGAAYVFAELASRATTSSSCRSRAGTRSPS